MMRPRRPRRRRGGFNLIELLISLAIMAVLLTASMVALDASFNAYQSTTESASTHTIGRLTVHRVLTLIRTGQSFEPMPVNPNDTVVTSDFIEFRTAPTLNCDEGLDIMVEWSEDDEALFITVENPCTGDSDTNLLLEGVVPQRDEHDELIMPFTLEYVRGLRLYRATVDLMIMADDNQSLSIEGDEVEPIRLVASAMPRTQAFAD